MSERRRVPRCAFGGVAEITTIHPNTYLLVSTAELSRFGCFVTTCATMRKGTIVGLKITFEGCIFSATGEVTYVLPEKGMGIKFITTEPNDIALLEEWLGRQVKF